MSTFDQFNWQGSRGFPYFWGYYWLGPINPHLIPPQFGLTDTVTGVVYYLVLNSAGDHLQLTTNAPPGPNKVIPAGDYLFMGQYNVGLQVIGAHLTVTVFDTQRVGGTVFAPNAQAGIATLIGGLFLTDITGKFGVNALRPGQSHISVAVATIAAKATPTEPTQIPPPVAYSGYYYELQDAEITGNLT